jgi:hypothetical protein
LPAAEADFGDGGGETRGEAVLHGNSWGKRRRG